MIAVPLRVFAFRVVYRITDFLHVWGGAVLHFGAHYHHHQTQATSGGEMQRSHPYILHMD